MVEALPQQEFDAENQDEIEMQPDSSNDPWAEIPMKFQSDPIDFKTDAELDSGEKRQLTDST